MPEQPGVEKSFMDGVFRDLGPMADAVSALLGPSHDSQRYTLAQQIELATFSPVADPKERQMRAWQMLQSGMTAEQVTDKLYPQLRQLITLSGTNVKERIAYAKYLRGEIDKRELADRPIEDMANEMADLLGSPPEQAAAAVGLPIVEPTAPSPEQALERPTVPIAATPPVESPALPTPPSIPGPSFSGYMGG